MQTDLSQKIQKKVIESMSLEEKISLFEKGVKEIMLINPSYGIEYLKRKFKKKRAHEK